MERFERFHCFASSELRTFFKISFLYFNGELGIESTMIWIFFHLKRLIKLNLRGNIPFYKITNLCTYIYLFSLTNFNEDKELLIDISFIYYAKVVYWCDVDGLNKKNLDKILYQKFMSLFREKTCEKIFIIQ